MGPQAQEEDLAVVHQRQEAIGYPTDLITGEADVAAHMGSLFADWRAEGLSGCLHEHRGGFAFNRESMEGLAGKAREAGARIEGGVQVTGFALDGAGAVTTVHTDRGDVAVGEQVVVAVGPWVKGLWEQLGLPRRLDVRTPAGELHRDQEMWT